MDELELLRQKVDRLEELIGMLIASDRYIFQRNIQLMDGRNIQLATGTGTKVGTATTQKLGFFGETPIVQQTTTSQSPAAFSANTSGISNDSATWGGYTVGDIVAILQAF